MSNEILEQFANREYKWGFVSDVESESLAPGLNEEVVRTISEKKGEPAWMLEWRLAAYERWLAMSMPKKSVRRNGTELW